MAEGRTVGSLVVELVGSTGDFDKKIKAAFVRGEEAVRKFDKAVGSASRIADFMVKLGQMAGSASRVASAFVKVGTVLGKVLLPLGLLIKLVEKIIIEFKIATGTATGWEKLHSKITRLTIAFDKMLIPGSRIGTMLSKIAVKLGKLGTKMLQTVTHPIKSLENGFNKLKTAASNAVDKIKGAFNKFHNFMQGIGGKISLVAAGMFGGLTYAAKKLGESVIDLGSEFEQYKITLGELLKQDVGGFLDMLRERAKKTTMTFRDYVKAAVSLVGVFGEGDEFKRVIDLSADLTAGLESIGVTSEEVTRALRKLKTGQLGEAFERLQEWGVANWQDIFPEVDTVEGVRALGLDVVFERMMAAMEENWGEMAEKSVASLEGLKTNIKDYFDSFLLIIAGSGFYDAVREQAQELLNTIERFDQEGKLETWGQSIGVALEGTIKLFNAVRIGVTELISLNVGETLKSFFDIGGTENIAGAFDKITAKVPVLMAKLQELIDWIKAEFEKIKTDILSSLESGGSMSGAIVNSLKDILTDVANTIDTQPFADLGMRIADDIIQGIQDRIDEFMRNRKGLGGITYRLIDAMMDEGEISQTTSGTRF